MAGFRATGTDSRPARWRTSIRVFADGPEVGVHIVVSGDRPAAIPSAMSATGPAAARVPPRRSPRLRDLRDQRSQRAGSLTGAERSSPKPAPRCGSASRRPIWRALLAALSATIGTATRRPPFEIRALPTDVDPTTLVPAARLDEPPWCIPIGLGDETLGPVGLTLYPGEHALVCGPPRSGRTSTLRTVAHVAHTSRADLTIVAIAGPHSCLAATCGLDRVLATDCDRASIDDVGEISGPVLVLVDDADLVEDQHGGLQALLDLRRTGPPRRRGGKFGGAALALRPLDAERFGPVGTGSCYSLILISTATCSAVRLPRRAPVGLSRGRGYLVTGSELDVVQVAAFD